MTSFLSDTCIVCGSVILSAFNTGDPIQKCPSCQERERTTREIPKDQMRITENEREELAEMG
jgi:uncharacterized Zn finger protein (UPF0148 family)